jgi:Uma2 family endonuclease
VRTATGPFTRADYLRLPEGFPAQLIAGWLVKEAAPIYGHQMVVVRLCGLLLRLVDADRVLVSPVDVPIDDRNVYQPDVAVFRSALPPESGGVEIPLLALEVLSPSTKRWDRGVKRRKYLEGGVEEVWLVDREARRIEVHTAAGVREAVGAETLRSSALPGLAVSPDDLLPRRA